MVLHPRHRGELCWSSFVATRTKPQRLQLGRSPLRERRYSSTRRAPGRAHLQCPT